MAHLGPSQHASAESPLDYTQGQRHDRLLSRKNDMSSEPVETSLTQKMMSAVIGSVLTSLLGPKQPSKALLLWRNH